MKNENLEFRDALRQLAEEAGVPLSDSPQMSAQAAARKAHISANNAAAAFFREQLAESPTAQFVRDYAAEHAVTPEDAVAVGMQEKAAEYRDGRSG